MSTKTIKTECPYCHQPDVLEVNDYITIPEPVMRACPTCWERKIKDAVFRPYPCPVCPNCHTPQREWKYLNLENDGDTAEVECLECGVKYTTQINISVTFESEAL